MKVVYRRRYAVKIWIAVLMTLAVVATAAVYILWLNSAGDKSSKTEGSVAVEVGDEPKPSESIPKGVPTKISIPSVGIEAPIIPVGLTPTGQMDAPSTLTDVGWYTGSSEVGDGKYSVLLDGHYGRPGNPGVFFSLQEVSVGDEIEVFGEDSEAVVYNVVEVERLPQEDVDMRKAMMPYRDGVESVTLITCYGEYDVFGRDYSHRIVVYAERIVS